MPNSKTPRRGVSTRQSAPNRKTPSSPMTPGWSKARPEMFTPVVADSPFDLQNTPSPFKNRRMTRRSSVYVMASKMKKPLLSPKKVSAKVAKETTDFKKPVTTIRSRRQSMIQRTQNVRSPKMTRARRASVYVSSAKNTVVIHEEMQQTKPSPKKPAKSPQETAKRSTVKMAAISSKSPSRSPSKSPEKKTPVQVRTPLQGRRALRESTRKASTKKRSLTPKATVTHLKTPQSSKVSPGTISSILSRKVVVQVAQLGTPTANRSPKTPIKAAKILGKVTIRTTPRQTRRMQDLVKPETPLTSTPVKSTKKRKADGPPPVSEIRQMKTLRNSKHDESVFPTPDPAGGDASINGLDVSSLKQSLNRSRELSKSSLDETADDGWMQWCTIL